MFKKLFILVFGGRWVEVHTSTNDTWVEWEKIPGGRRRVIMGFTKRWSQYFCKHLPVTTHGFTRKKKDGSTQTKIKWECLKCGKRIPTRR